MYKATLRRVHVTIFAVEKQQVLHICVRFCVCVCMRARGCGFRGVCLRACSLTYPACNAPPYCQLQSPWLHHIFGHTVINSTTVGKTVAERKMCGLVFSTAYIWSICRCKNSARCCHECENGVMQSTRYLCRSLVKLEFSRQLFESTSHTKFHQNPFSRRRFFPCGRTDMTKLIVTFRRLVNALCFRWQ